jgi:hypothetical protein
MDLALLSGFDAPEGYVPSRIVSAQWHAHCSDSSVLAQQSRYAARFPPVEYETYAVTD